MRFILGLACLFLLLSCAPEAPEQNTESGNYIMNGCRSYLNNPAPNRTDKWLMVSGFCAGVVAALMDASGALKEPYKFCPPSQTTCSQAVRVAAGHIDSIPNRADEHFVVLALEAFRKAWPC